MLQNKVIIITGAASGISEAAAHDFAAAGARLVLADVDEANGQRVAEEVRATGAQAHFIKTDMRSEPDIAAMVNSAVAAFGGLDGAFNNAGVPPRNKTVDELTLDDWDFVQDVNLRANFLCTKYQSRAMRDSGGGAIVYTSSIAGILGGVNTADYSASKSGLIGFMRCVSTEYSLTTVRANAIVPGLVMTPMLKDFTQEDGTLIPALTPQLERYSLGRAAQPIDVARAAKWLLSDESSMINGIVLPIDAGFSIRY